MHYMRERVLKRTGELVRWARMRHVTIDVLERLWRLYVERSALYGAALLDLPPSGARTLDRIQRKAGRMVLGFGSRSPTPAVLLELGWCKWSTAIVGEKGRLLQRIVNSDSAYVAAAFRCSADADAGWVSKTAAVIRPWREDGLPTERAQWRAMLRAWQLDFTECEAEQAWQECLAHERLGLYQPGPWIQRREVGINRCLHDKAIGDDEARLVARLLCGGQGLRGADYRQAPQPDKYNCCICCLRMGVCVVETLAHVMFECPGHDVAREASGLGHVMQRANSRILCHHRGAWTWAQLRAIRRFLMEMLRCRALAVDEWRGRGRRAEHATAAALWEELEMAEAMAREDTCDSG